MLPSTPPPPARKPGLRRAGVDTHRDPIRLALRDWMRERFVSVRDLVAVVRAPSSRIEAVLSGDAPLPYEWLSLLPARDRHDLQARIDRAIAARSAA